VSESYEVLSPWAEVDPLPLRGITPRLPDLEGKKIGLFVYAAKIASHPVQTVMEKRLKERFPTAKFSWYFNTRGEVSEAELPKYKDWLKGLDALVAAYGD
jgi:hypothetical protein